MIGNLWSDRLYRSAAILWPFALPPIFLYIHNDVFGVTSAAILFTSLTFVALGFLAALVAAIFHRHGERADSFALIFSMCMVCLFWLFLVAVIGSLFSNRFWGDNLSYALFADVLQRPGALLSFTVLKVFSPLSQKMILVIFAITISSGVFWLVYRTTKSARISDLLQMATAKTAFYLIASIAIILYSTVAAILVNAKPLALRGEPLSSFFMLAQTSGLIGWERDRIAAAIEDREVTENYPTVSSFDKRNVVLILVESLRPDHLGVAGYSRQTTPFLSHLMDSGKLTLIHTAHSTCSESFCGIASTLSSRPYHQLSNDNFKLNNALRRNGYNIQYNLSGDHRAWRFLWDFYGNDVDSKIDPVARGDNEAADDRSMIFHFSESLKTFHGTPTFFYFFLMSTHAIGGKYAEFARYQPAELDLTFLSPFYSPVTTVFDPHGVPVFPPMPPEERKIYANRYDNGIVQADQMIREIFASLEAKGYLKDSIVIIAGDHGESLGERGHLLHARHLYEKDMRIPLIVYDDRRLKLANSSYASQIDIAPTILARLGLPQPSSWRGRSLTEPFKPTLTIHQTRLRERMCVAVVDRTEAYFVKYIECIHQNGTKSEEFFDLNSDPEELSNVVDRKSDQLQHYREITSSRLNAARCGGDGASCEIFSR